MKAELYPLRLQSVLLFSLAVVVYGAAGNPEQYGFQEGEPLAYKTEVAVVVDTTRESKYFEHSGKSKGKTNATFELEYQLLPIAHERLWKVRLVLDQVKRAINRDGEVDTATFDRTQLKHQQLSVGDMLNLNIWEMGLRTEQNGEDEPEETTTPPNHSSLGPKVEKTQRVHVPEDLFDRPILTWFAPDGTLEDFEDRSETQQIMDGLDLKECIKLLIPPLPSVELKTGVSWTRKEPVDLPEPSLNGQKYEPMSWTLTYTIKSVERIGERLCARIAVRGTFARDGLWIPVAEEKRKYLIWTTMITKLQDRIDGEYLYDVEQKVMRASTISNTYNYSTVEARKEDNYRGQILTENSLQTRITSALVEPAQASRDPGDSSRPGVSTDNMTSDTSKEIDLTFASQTFNEPKPKSSSE